MDKEQNKIDWWETPDEDYPRTCWRLGPRYEIAEVWCAENMAHVVYWPDDDPRIRRMYYALYMADRRDRVWSDYYATLEEAKAAVEQHRAGALS